MTEETTTTTLKIDGDTLADLMAFSASFTLIEDAVQTLVDAPLQDDEVTAYLLLPVEFRMKITARLVELADLMREALLDIDGRVLQLGARPQGA